jgi:hypothetical protein
MLYILGYDMRLILSLCEICRHPRAASHMAAHDQSRGQIAIVAVRTFIICNADERQSEQEGGR